MSRRFGGLGELRIRLAMEALKRIDEGFQGEGGIEDRLHALLPVRLDRLTDLPGVRRRLIHDTVADLLLAALE
jgi:hypothetical protein